MLVKDRYNPPVEHNPLIEQEYPNQSGKLLYPSGRRNHFRRWQSKKIANVPLPPKSQPYTTHLRMGFLVGSPLSGSVLVSAKQDSEKQFISSASYSTSSEVMNQSNIQITKSLLLELLQEEEEDDYGILRPTLYAFDKTWNLLENASKILKTEFPKAWVSTDENGGISLTWSKVISNAEVSLMCGASPENQTYIYHEHRDEYGVEKEVSVSSLVYWIKWLNRV